MSAYPSWWFRPTLPGSKFSMHSIQTVDQMCMWKTLYGKERAIAWLWILQSYQTELYLVS